MPEVPVPPENLAIPAIARMPGAEACSVTLDGVRWNYWRAGSGPALLLIHGFMGYAFSWRFNLADLARDFSVYAPDLGGCGFSQRVDVVQTTLAADAEAMLRFMDRLGIEDAYVLGSSRGGGLALALAALLARRGMAHRMRRLILVSPINPWSSNGLLMTRLLATAMGGLAVLHVIPHMPFLVRGYFKRLYGDPRRIAPGSFEGYRAGLDEPGSFPHLLRIVRSWRDDLSLVEQSLGEVGELPVLLLWGDCDRAVYASSLPQLQQRLINSATLLMPGVGHLPYEEVPEEFNRVVRDFLLHNTPLTALEKPSVISYQSTAQT